jgi:zinc-finger of acetyl-transferase ESCO
MHISFADTLRLKREAKKLRSAFPGKTLSHHQSIVVQNLFGLRDLHEFNQLRKQSIERHVSHSDGLATCTFCGMNFCPAHAEDRKLHKARHDAFEEAISALNYAPQLLDARDASKRDGYLLVANANSEDQTQGALMVMRAWFDRSLDAAIDNGYWKKHPKFNSYISYIVGATPSFPAHVVALLKQQYGQTDGVIPKGGSYWYPPKK